MAPERRTILFNLLKVLVVPYARFCLRHGLKLQDAIEGLKSGLIEAAEDELKQASVKPNVSKLSVMTGVHRRDIDRLSAETPSTTYSTDPITRIVGHWQSDPEFLTSAKAPRVLSAGQDDSEFAQLVRKVTKDIGPGTVLFELERAGMVEFRKTGIALVKGSYTPPSGNSEEGFRLLARDLNDLTQAVEENVLEQPQPPHLHAHTEFDNIRPDAAASISEWLLREGHKLHLRAREMLSQHDQDVNPDSSFKGRGLKVVLGAFSYVKKNKK